MLPSPTLKIWEDLEYITRTWHSPPLTTPFCGHGVVQAVLETGPTFVDALDPFSKWNHPPFRPPFEHSHRAQQIGLCQDKPPLQFT